MDILSIIRVILTLTADSSSKDDCKTCAPIKQFCSCKTDINNRIYQVTCKTMPTSFKNVCLNFLQSMKFSDNTIRRLKGDPFNNMRVGHSNSVAFDFNSGIIEVVEPSLFKAVGNFAFELSFDSNRIKSFPSAKDLKFVSRISLASNRLSHVPAFQLCEAPSLKYIDIHDNPAVREINAAPASFKYCSKLRSVIWGVKSMNCQCSTLLQYFKHPHEFSGLPFYNTKGDPVVCSQSSFKAFRGMQSSKIDKRLVYSACDYSFASKPMPSICLILILSSFFAIV